MGFCSMLLLSNILLTAWLSTANGKAFFDEEDEFPVSFEVQLCDFPQFKNGHLHDEESWRHHFPVSKGNKYSYTCDNGFSPPSGHSWDYLYCTAQGWEPEVPCIRQCVFHYGENGESSDMEKIYVQGQSVKVQCPSGYSFPNDQDTMTCTENGWDPPPKCFRISTCSVSDIEIENGFFSESDFTYALNRETSYRCKQGYVTNTGETSGSITCLQNGWSPQPSCIKSCERPVFENSVTKNNSTWFKLNDKLAYECLHGYKNEYKHTKGSITCTYNGWSDTPSCYEVTCSPPYIPNVIYTSHRITYRTGDVIRYECKNGFYPTTGSTISWCTTYGWIPPPRCSWKHCDFPQFKYGHLFYEDSLKTTFPVSIGKKYSYKCDNGFSPPSGNSRDYLHCTAKGWKPEVPCVRKCVFHYGENGESSDIEQIYVQGQAVKVQCPSGYSFPNDQDTMTCTENGWDPPPKCFRIKTCSVSDIEIENGFFSESDGTYDLNRVTSYRCKQGYVTNTGETSGSITCLQNGWSLQPSCIKSCERPVFENSVTKNNSTWFKLNDKLDYECLLGYENEYKHTKGSITCTYHGWSDIPSCYEEEKTCGDIPELEHGSVKFSVPPYHHGDSVEFTCSETFTMIGHGLVSCINGKWTQLPRCVDSTKACGPPPPIDNGDITSLSLPVYAPLSSVDYQCQKYYLLKGKKTATCRNGKWSEPPTCLHACVIREDIMERFNIILRWREDKKVYIQSGEDIEFACKPRYREARGSPPFHTKCINGHIHYPTCV